MFRSESRRFRRRMGCGLIFAGMLFVSAFIILWTNEGRTNMATIAAASTLVVADEISTIDEGQFIALQGQLAGVEPLGDPGLLKPGPYLEIQRSVEMYAWAEDSIDNNDENLDYTYRQEWTKSPEDSSKFHDGGEHVNPPMRYASETIGATRARIGDVRVNVQELDLPATVPLSLNESLLGAGDDPAGTVRSIAGNYLYIGQGHIDEPRTGDLRVSYEVFDADQQVTLFGQLADGEVIPYVHSDDSRLFRAFTSGREEAIQEMGREYRFSLWGLRMAGFVLIWIGLMVLAGPITAILGRVPAVGRMGNLIIALLALLLAFIVASTIIMLSIITHTPWLLAIIILIGAVIVYWIWQTQKSESTQS